MPEHYETPQGHSKPPEPQAISEPIQITQAEGQTTGDLETEVLENKYYKLLAVTGNSGNIGFTLNEGSDLAAGFSWFCNSLWPYTVRNPGGGAYLEANYSPAEIKTRINKETRILEEYRVRMKKPNPTDPDKTMDIEKPIAFFDLILNYQPTKPCGWAEIVDELRPQALREQALAAEAGVARAVEAEKLRQAHIARMNPNAALAAGIASGVAEALRSLGIKPQEAK